jgi:Zn-dependent M28 family amino/carboxypeptidase
MPIRSASNRVLVAGLVAWVSALGACSSGPPAADAQTVDPIALLGADSVRILDELRHLSSDSLEGRGTGTPGAAAARAYLAAELAGAGVRPLGDGFDHSFTWHGRSSPEVHTGVNVIGIVPGGALAGRYIVVSAHYDHLGIRGGEIFNGADDDASGCVALVAMARALRDVPMRHSLVFAAFDAEEAGLRGSRAFVADPPVPLDSIALDLNLDMVARTAGVLWAGGAYHTPALRAVLERVAAEAPLDLRLGHDSPGAPEGDDWTQSSDHGPFHDVGIPFVYLGVEDHPDYHQPTDDFQNIDPGEYMDALRTALMTLVALDQALPLPDASSPGSEPRR